MNDTLINKARVVKRRIDNNENICNVGTVINVLDYIVEISNLNEVSLYESISIGESTGFIIEIKYNKAVAIMTEIIGNIKIGDEVMPSKKTFKCLYSLDSVGRITDIFGHNLMNDKMLSDLVNIDVIKKDIPLLDRVLPNTKINTGIKGLDMLNPLVKGSTILISGKSGLGKSTLASSIVANQVNKDIVCFYIALNKSKKEIKKLFEDLSREEAARYTGVFATFDNEVVKTYLTPLVVVNIATELMLQGYNTLIVIDDVNEFINAENEINSKLNKTTTYKNVELLLDSSLVHKDGGSITLLPIVDSSNKDLLDAAMSTSNGVISMSEYLQTRGIYPAIDYLHSSSNNKKYLTSDTKELESKIIKVLEEYETTKKKYTGISVEAYGKETNEVIINGEKIYNALKQEKFTNKSTDELEKELNFLGKEA